MENNPLVSVIMNCYNSDEFLEEAIESILNQTYQNLEIIFWDNQSTDNSAKIVKSYNDNRIKYFYAPEFTPLGKARNLAIDKTQGEWIAFLDCDDIWDREKLQISFEELSSQKSIESITLIYSKTEIIDRDGKIIGKVDKSISGDIHDKLLIDGNFITFSSIIVQKDSLIQNGKIDESLNYCEDLDLLLKITKNNIALGVNKYLILYRIHSNNITSTKIYENDIEVVKFLNKYIDDNRLNLYIRYKVFINNSYRLISLFIKLLIRKEYKKILGIKL